MAVMHENRINEGALAPARLAPSARRRPGWQLAIGVLMTLGILVLAFFKRAWLIEAIGLAGAAQPAWLLLGLVTIVRSFLISSQVFLVVLVRWGIASACSACGPRRWSQL